MGRLLLGALLLLVGAPTGLDAQGIAAPPVDPLRRSALLLRKLHRPERVLYITAHPDDEDGGLLAKLDHGLGMETALLTLTRGEGGQNEIGEELFHALGTLRTQESFAARRYDGAMQYFGEAFEFGYSFSVEETFDKWGVAATVESIVRVIRQFRPDIVITMMPTGEGGGQHHQASARLARQGVELAAASDREDLGRPHAVARLFCNLWSNDPVEHLCTEDLAQYDPVLGMNYAEIGALSRGMHKCQGMVRLHDPFWQRQSRLEWLWGGNPRALESLFEGLPTGRWFEDPNLESEIRRLLPARDLALRTTSERVSGVESLLPLIDRLQQIESSFGAQRWQQSRAAGLLRYAEELLRHLLGLRVEAVCDRSAYCDGESLTVRIVIDNGSPYTVSWKETSLLGGALSQAETSATPPKRIPAGERRAIPRRWTLAGFDPSGTTQRAVTPYPLHEPQTPALSFDSHLDDGQLALMGEWSIVLSKERTLRISSGRIPLEHVSINAEFPDWQRQTVQVVPEPSIRGAREVVAAPVVSATRPRARIEVRVSSVEPGRIAVQPLLPSGWSCEPAERVVNCTQPEVESTHEFTLVGPIFGGAGSPASSAEAPRDGTEQLDVTFLARRLRDGRESRSGYRRVDYPHIRGSRLFRPAQVRVRVFECAAVDKSVGYVVGTGDEVPRALEALGCRVEKLSAEQLVGDLSHLSVIVLGVRAYKVRRDLRASQEHLLAWVEAGGTLIVQYNKFEFNEEELPQKASPFSPWQGARVSRKRVTVEESPIRVLVPDHPIFNTPHRISAEDWSGWVQERGLYFLDLKDPRLVDLIECEDPVPYNAGPKRGALVEARYGKGRWIYVGLGLFRQLPAGVPGAYRLLANMLSLPRR